MRTKPESSRKIKNSKKSSKVIQSNKKIASTFEHYAMIRELDAIESEIDDIKYLKSLLDKGLVNTDRDEDIIIVTRLIKEGYIDDTSEGVISFLEKPYKYEEELEESIKDSLDQEFDSFHKIAMEIKKVDDESNIFEYKMSIISKKIQEINKKIR